MNGAPTFGGVTALFTLAAASFAVFGIAVAWAGIHPAAAYIAAVLGYALFVSVVLWITANTEGTIRLR